MFNYTEKKEYPHSIAFYDVKIPVSDGINLSANLFFPKDFQNQKYPVIFEMIPYRKDDWRYSTDHQLMSFFTKNGYIWCRVDVRGTGSSEGIALDEYTQRETQDGYEIIEWLAQQDFCNGNIGMWGISYGGFNSIQIAKLQPSHLKAIAPVFASDDRYLVDVHYIGGCLTAGENSNYSINQIGLNSLPPIPEEEENIWLSKWKERLDNTPPWILNWLKHQVDGPYWKQGSLAPDYEKIQCAICLVGSWNDSYTDSVFRMMEKCTNIQKKAIIGNWAHGLPNHSTPGPKIDWLERLLAFFDNTLKNIQNAFFDKFHFTLFLKEYSKPISFPEDFKGEWISFKTPIIPSSQKTYYLTENLLKTTPPLREEKFFDKSNPSLGTKANLSLAGGEVPYSAARDLRSEDALRIVFQTPPLDSDLVVIGFPQFKCYLSSSSPVSNLIVYLSDVSPDGPVSLVTTGILNLTHRKSHSFPTALEKDKIYEINLTLKALGYKFKKGNSLRISIGNSYFPIIWPSPYLFENCFYSSPLYPSKLELPIVSSTTYQKTDKDKIELIEEPQLGKYKDFEPKTEIVEDLLADSITVKFCMGDAVQLPNQTVLASSEKLYLTVYNKTPEIAELRSQILYGLKNKFQKPIESRTYCEIKSDLTSFNVSIHLTVEYDNQPFFEKQWIEKIPRHLL